MQNETDERIRKLHFKRSIQYFEKCAGLSNTSLITVYIPPKDDINKVNTLLANEYGSASCIKNRVNRLSVQSALKSAQQRLKLFTRTPPNGLVILSGKIVTGEGKEKKISTTVEPFRPINSFYYKCGNSFFLDPLKDLLKSEKTVGFIIIDGKCTLYATLSGTTKKVLHKFSDDLPKKHKKGGQSAARFGRLRDEKRHNYIRKAAEFAVQHFVKDDKVWVSKIVVAGNAEFKNMLVKSSLLDQRLKKVIPTTIDIGYGGLNGLNEAIIKSAGIIENQDLIEEMNVLTDIFERMAKCDPLLSIGVKETMEALELSAIDQLIVWDGLEYRRIENDDNTITYNAKSGEGTDLIDWLIENHKNVGTKIIFVSANTSQGSMFKSMGGMACILRYKIEFTCNNIDDSEEDDWVNSDDYGDFEDFM